MALLRITYILRTCRGQCRRRSDIVAGVPHVEDRLRGALVLGDRLLEALLLERALPQPRHPLRHFLVDARQQRRGRTLLPLAAVPGRPLVQPKLLVKAVRPLHKHTEAQILQA